MYVSDILELFSYDPRFSPDVALIERLVVLVLVAES